MTAREVTVAQRGDMPSAGRTPPGKSLSGAKSPPSRHARSAPPRGRSRTIAVTGERRVGGAPPGLPQRAHQQRRAAEGSSRTQTGVHDDEEGTLGDMALFGLIGDQRLHERPEEDRPNNVNGVSVLHDESSFIDNFFAGTDSAIKNETDTEVDPAAAHHTSPITNQALGVAAGRDQSAAINKHHRNSDGNNPVSAIASSVGVGDISNAKRTPTRTQSRFSSWFHDPPPQELEQENGAPSTPPPSDSGSWRRQPSDPPSRREQDTKSWRREPTIINSNTDDSLSSTREEIRDKKSRSVGGDKKKKTSIPTKRAVAPPPGFPLTDNTISKRPPPGFESQKEQVPSEEIFVPHEENVSAEVVKASIEPVEVPVSHDMPQGAVIHAEEAEQTLSGHPKPKNLKDYIPQSKRKSFSAVAAKLPLAFTLGIIPGSAFPALDCPPTGMKK